MESLKISSCQAPNADFIGEAITRYVSRRLGIAAEFRIDIPWQERYRRLDEGDIHVCWICGLPYIKRAGRQKAQIELLAAPVMKGARYQGRPVYFSDVVVQADSRFQSFVDLRGASWAYNEPGSHSGYNVTRWYLASRGYGTGFFGRVIGSGGHQISLQMILDRQIDASAIDSTVLETELAHRPELASQIRIVETLGPSPIPPWVMSRDLPQALKQALRDALRDMHADELSRAALMEGRVDHFAVVQDRDYDPIREMDRVGGQIQL